MACSNPNYIAYDRTLKKILFLGKNKHLSDGAKKSLESQYSSMEILMVPCGQCQNCLVARSKSWALRCMCEASLYQSNYFVTLTYNDECNPGKLSKADFRQFIKNVRNKFGANIRYFGCGEYGPSTLRPHYHLIMFNLNLDDVKPYAPGAISGNYLISESLKKCWPFGHITIGEVSYGSCAYVARYCTKKIGSDKGNFKTFQLMSNHPGIGAEYFNKHFKNIYDCDCCYLQDGKVLQPPRYFDRLLEKIDDEYLKSIKDVRLSNAQARTIDSILDHLLVSEEGLIRYNRQVSDNKQHRKDL